MAGKGDFPRPIGDRAEYNRRFDAVFGKCQEHPNYDPATQGEPQVNCVVCRRLFREHLYDTPNSDARKGR